MGTKRERLVFTMPGVTLRTMRPGSRRASSNVKLSSAHCGHRRGPEASQAKRGAAGALANKEYGGLTHLADGVGMSQAVLPWELLQAVHRLRGPSLLQPRPHVDHVGRIVVLRAMGWARVTLRASGPGPASRTLAVAFSSGRREWMRRKGP